jgi:hypothetical protein
MRAKSSNVDPSTSPSFSNGLSQEVVDAAETLGSVPLSAERDRAATEPNRPERPLNVRLASYSGRLITAVSPLLGCTAQLLIVRLTTYGVRHIREITQLTWRDESAGMDAAVARDPG